MSRARSTAGKQSKPKAVEKTPFDMTIGELLHKLAVMGDQRMHDHWDGFHLELFSDGSGSINYEWFNHPFAEPNEIPFQSIPELVALLG